jgi:prepilin-type processing-associated H-X9-DG protein
MVLDLCGSDWPYLAWLSARQEYTSGDEHEQKFSAANNITFQGEATGVYRHGTFDRCRGHGFETSHGEFHARKSRRSPVEAYHELSWLRQILPYAEQAAVWSLSERALKVEPFPYFNPPHEPLGMAIPLFACPDDSRVSVPQAASQLNGAFAGLTSYPGVMGSDYRSQDGSFVLGKRIRFADITDGTSNTVMIGERPPTPDYNYGWWYTGMGQDGSGSVDMLLGAREIVDPAGRFAKWNCPPTNRFKPGAPDSMCDGLHFWSLHDSGAHFALCDGSVRFMAYESASVLEQMATRGGGESVPN